MLAALAIPQEDTPSKDAKNKGDKDNDQPVPQEKIHNPVLWQKPDNIPGLDLFLGQGGEKHKPAPPFTFLEEDMDGTNPKFDANDANDRKWRVKLGEESRPEVVASRLLWAMGYFVQDDYVMPQADIHGLKMKRGGKFFKGEHITDARFSRKPSGQKKIGIWEWKKNPFYGTREFNGLRVMVALINDWDLKDVNNAVYEDKDNDRQIFLVSDTGATFATNSLATSRKKDKGNVDSYRNSKFITRKTDTEVDFGTPAPPTGVLFASAGILSSDYMRRKGYDWIGDNIPIDDARWMGSMLGELTREQIADAFRAGNFPPEEIVIYSTIVENRIQELKAL
ncbi:MAG TPA: hypothetical protein VGN16_02550 [Acidobacteriaceae bacterium]|jgi:hypothetical protein